MNRMLLPTASPNRATDMAITTRLRPRLWATFIGCSGAVRRGLRATFARAMEPRILEPTRKPSAAGEPAAALGSFYGQRPAVKRRWWYGMLSRRHVFLTPVSRVPRGAWDTPSPPADGRIGGPARIRRPCRCGTAILVVICSRAGSPCHENGPTRPDRQQDARNAPPPKKRPAGVGSTPARPPPCRPVPGRNRRAGNTICISNGLSRAGRAATVMVRLPGVPPPGSTPRTRWSNRVVHETR